MIEWTDVEGFSYSGAKSAPVFPDIHLTQYLAKTFPDALSADALRSHRVYGKSATSGSVFDKWPAYRCLYAEIALSGRTYLLTNGDWYLLEPDFVSQVDRAVSAIPTANFAPLAYAEGEDEGSYNARLAQSIDGACCLDRQLIQYGGGRSKVELCDVYSPSRQLIHVKRFRGSSVLSHLFAQGVVAATAFVADAGFREEANRLLPADLRVERPDERPNPSEYEIAYFVASKSLKPLTLPFFSRVTLRNACVQLASYGFRVSLTKVQIA